VGGAAAADFAGGAGVRLEGFDHLVEVLLGQVNLIQGALEAEGHRLVGVAAVDVVGQE
jgi:hypothetical protein